MFHPPRIFPCNSQQSVQWTLHRYQRSLCYNHFLSYRDENTSFLLNPHHLQFFLKPLPFVSTSIVSEFFSKPCITVGLIHAIVISSNCHLHPMIDSLKPARCLDFITSMSMHDWVATAVLSQQNDLHLPLLHQ